MYPVTNLGRTIVILSSVVGTILISLLIINIQTSMTLNDRELQVILYNKVYLGVLIYGKNTR